MKGRVLLTHSYFYRFDPKQWKGKHFYPPLGTLYAASVLREAGAEVVLFDSCLSESPKDLLPLLEKHDPGLLVIYDDGFNYLTKMCLTNMREAAFEMIRMGKERDCRVIVSSSDSTDHYEDYLERGADYIILGEGEETLKRLFKGIASGGAPDFSKLKGIAFNNNGNVVKNPLRPVIRELDELPLPAWDLVDLQRYRKIWINNHGYFSINIATTRGCPYNCNWCAKPIYGYEYNTRSPRRVIEEMAHLMGSHGVSHFWICDDIFGLKKGWIREFRELADEKDLRFRYTCQSRADLVIKNGVAGDMAASGAEMVWLGAESGSQRILDAMNKGQTVEQIKKAGNVLREHGIKTAFFIQFGYLGEQVEDIRKTIDMILELMPDDIGVSISYPLPGTPFYEQVKKDLREKANWSDSDDLALMYEGTFSAEYYRRLHRYVHRIYRRKQRWKYLKRNLFRPSHWDLHMVRMLLAVLYYNPALFFDRIKLKKLGNI